jgi:hypothetical protein
MADAGIYTWLGLFGLGALHGINPGMGWLFAVALGLQERRARAVWRALPPLALGHALAVGSVVALVVAVGWTLPPAVLKWTVVALLGGLGTYRLFRHAHPRYGGMQVGGRELTIWSFLMATAHGAGIMVLPLVLPGESAGVAGAAHAGHAAHVAMGVPAGTMDGASSAPALAGFGGDQLLGALAALTHTVGYLLVMGVIAVLVYRRLGLKLLRKAWINLDLVWSVALIGTAVATALL